MLLAIVSFTGYGSTSDLTENSNLVLVDNDVGDVVAGAIIVDFELNVLELSSAMHMEIQVLEKPFTQKQRWCYLFLESEYTYSLIKLIEPPNYYNLTNENYTGTTYRRARDSL